MSEFRESLIKLPTESTHQTFSLTGQKFCTSPMGFILSAFSQNLRIRRQSHGIVLTIACTALMETGSSKESEKV